MYNGPGFFSSALVLTGMLGSHVGEPLVSACVSTDQGLWVGCELATTYNLVWLD